MNPSEGADLERELRRRADDLLKSIHALTLSREAGQVTLQESLTQESSLVAELGRIQDRLRLLGCHAYDGCPACRARPSNLN